VMTQPSERGTFSSGHEPGRMAAMSAGVPTRDESVVRPRTPSPVQAAAAGAGSPGLRARGQIGRLIVGPGGQSLISECVQDCVDELA
jgi:hypothetical protein